MGLPALGVAIYGIVYYLVYPVPNVSAINPATGALLVLGLLFLAIPLMFVSEKKRIPARIDELGVTLRNGVQLPWGEYRGPRIQTERLRSGRTIEVGLELLFARGTAMIRYRPITNLSDLGFIIEALKQHRNPFA